MEERLIQIVGHFFKYDTALARNILIKEGLFLCVDKVIGEDEQKQYLIHVVDPSGQYSYCRTLIISDALIQFNSQDQLLMWVGQEKPDGAVPAWVFYLINEADIKPMQGVITKCLFEMNHARLFREAASNKGPNSSKSESDTGVDDSWLESQIVCDRAQAVNDGASGNDSDFEYDGMRDGERDFEM